MPRPVARASRAPAVGVPRHGSSEGWTGGALTPRASSTSLAIERQHLDVIGRRRGPAAHFSLDRTSLTHEGRVPAGHEAAAGDAGSGRGASGGRPSCLTRRCPSPLLISTVRTRSPAGESLPRGRPRSCWPTERLAQYEAARCPAPRRHRPRSSRCRGLRPRTRRGPARARSTARCSRGSSGATSRRASPSSRGSRVAPSRPARS